VQRCLRHKERNVTEQLPERERRAVKQRLRRAWALDDQARALEQLRALAGELERSYPGAAGSLREGMDETLTLNPLGVRGNLKRTLQSTNQCESMIEIVRRNPAQRQALVAGRDSAALDRRRHARSRPAVSEIIGYRDLATVVIAIETTTSVTVMPKLPAPRTRRPLSSSTPDHHTGTATENPRTRDILARRRGLRDGSQIGVTSSHHPRLR